MDRIKITQFCNKFNKLAYQRKGMKFENAAEICKYNIQEFFITEDEEFWYVWKNPIYVNGRLKWQGDDWNIIERYSSGVTPDEIFINALPSYMHPLIVEGEPVIAVHYKIYNCTVEIL